MSSTLREIQSQLVRNVAQSRFWVIMCAMIILFAIIGPFGTFDLMSMPERLVYWTVTMIGSWAIAILAITTVYGVTGEWGSKHSLLVMLFGAGLAAFPMAAYLNLVMPVFLKTPPELNYWALLSYSLPISLSFSLIVYFALEERNNEPHESEDINALQKRLPIEKRGPVQHMSMQDHYISVTTTRGTELVLMRMADAVAALSKQNGLQIHRSHWVAKDAVTDSKRENSQPIVILKDRTELPVSRSFIKSAREAGII